jgi:Co/Zn/Cd efflux system component
MALISISLPDFEVPQLTNQVLLEVSVTLFMLFAVSELTGAMFSGSLSLLGDSVSMIVDVLSYISGIYVEWYKTNHGRFTKWSRINVEVVIPSLSMLSLIGVTLYITIDAVKVLLHPPTVNDVNVDYLYSYAAANLLVDLIVSFLFFFRGTDIFQEPSSVPVLSLDTSVNFDDPDDEFGHLDDILDFPLKSEKVDHANSKSLSALSNLFFVDTANHGGDQKANLNMISAFTHVFGDTLRTISMFVAALISTLSGIDGDICDAWAAIIVALSILVICGPILADIKSAAVEVWHDDTETTYNIRDITPNRNRSQNGQYTRVAEDDIIL